MTVHEALAAAEQLLPGHPAPDGVEDPRWQAIIEVGMFAEQEPEAIWPFVLKWGSHEDEDVRAAIASCLLERLLEDHFDLLFPLVETAARSNTWFAETTSICWKFGEAKEPMRAARFDRLCSDIRRGAV
jgi:HEAT repeat protein